MIKIGTVVVIKQWQDMVKEYWMTKIYQSITLPTMCFTQEMKQLCWQVWTVIDILWVEKEKYYKVSFDNKKLDADWLFTKHMFMRW